MTSYAFFKMAVTAPEVNCRFRVWWHNSLVLVESYTRTKFGRNLSVYVSDKTTSGLRKQTVTILDYYFWFRIDHLFHLDVILRLYTKFHPNRATAGRVRHFGFGISNERSPEKVSSWSDSWFRGYCYHRSPRIHFCDSTRPNPTQLVPDDAKTQIFKI